MQNLLGEHAPSPPPPPPPPPTKKQNKPIKQNVQCPGVVCAFASKKRKARCIAVGESENAMKRRKALLSEEELLVTKQRDNVHSQVRMPLIQAVA